MIEEILETKNVRKYFPIKKGLLGKVENYVKAVDGINIHIKRGETLAIVGESGCGKTTFGRLLVKLIEPTDGDIILKLEMGEKKKVNIRSLVQILFQDPYTSLNPRMKIKELMIGPLKRVGYKGVKLRNRMLEILKLVELKEQHLFRYPHELSGGQLQRINIARVLSMEPKFIVLDEPTSNLDVSVQAKILNLLKELQNKMDLTYLIITHDMGVVYYMATRVSVMYLGKIIETAEKKELFNNPLHPYTKALISCVPKIDPSLRIINTVELPEGDIPSSINPPHGCRFHTRCKDSYEKCGWAPSDLIKLLYKKLDISEVNRTKFIINKTSLKIVSDDVNLHDKILDFINIEKKSEHPMFKAINLINDNDTLVINFYEPTEPELISINENHKVACFLYGA